MKKNTIKDNNNFYSKERLIMADAGGVCMSVHHVWSIKKPLLLSSIAGAYERDEKKKLFELFHHKAGFEQRYRAWNNQKRAQHVENQDNGQKQSH
jgi:hypothetical protein